MNSHDKWLESPYDAAEELEARRQAAVASEMDALINEWANLPAASRDVDGFDLLMDERDLIVQQVCEILLKKGTVQDGQVITGLEVLVRIGLCMKERIERCALRVASHRMEVEA